MEKNFLRVTKQSPVTTIQGSQGTPVDKVTVTLTDGIDTMEADAFDQLASQLGREPLDPNGAYAAQLIITVSTWQKQDGSQGSANRIRLQRINRVG